MLEEISAKFDEYQFGALKNRSTTHELAHILHACHQAADNHNLLGQRSSTLRKHLITLITQSC
jgi:hypothetical protein